MSDDGVVAGPTLAEWEERMNDELSRIVQAGQGDLLTRWVLVTEAITPAGARAVSFVAAPGMVPYDVSGMLHYATRSNNMAIDYQLSGEGDDDDDS